MVVGRLCQRLRPCGTSIVVSGKRLSFWTLRFEEEGLENGFAQSRAAQVMSGFGKICAIAFWLNLVGVGLAMVVVAEPLLAGKLRSTHHASVTILVAMLLCSAACVFATKRACFKALSPGLREMFCVAFAIISMILYCVSDTYYLAKVMGDDPWQNRRPINGETPECDVSVFTDSSVLLIIEAAVIFSNFLMPIRWYFMTTVPIAGACVYTGLLGLGSPEQGSSEMKPLWNLIFLAFTLMVVSWGKRSEELRDRQQFASIIEEKRLRCSTEFKLERAERTLSKINSSAYGNRQSNPSATLSTAGSSSVGNAPLLDDIAQLGRKEHWLIDVDELEIVSEHRLGRGRFGVVVLGFLHGMPVAVKFSRERTGPQHLTVDMANELRVLRQVRHPNIVMFHGACVADGPGSIALAIEFIGSGLTLDKFVGNQACPDSMVPLVERYELISGLCSAMRYLHSRRPLIVHGDLKDINVMVESGPRAKLLDFGLSRLVKKGARAVGGTLRWSAPEVILNMCMMPNWTADVFSLGRVLSFIVSGEQPLKKLKKQAIFRLASAGKLTCAHEPIQDKLAVHSLQIIGRCLSSDAVARPSMKIICDSIALWPKQLDFEPVSNMNYHMSSRRALKDGADLSAQLALACESLPPRTDDSDSGDSSLCHNQNCAISRSGSEIDQSKQFDSESMSLGSRTMAL